MTEFLTLFARWMDREMDKGLIRGCSSVRFTPDGALVFDAWGTSWTYRPEGSR